MADHGNILTWCRAEQQPGPGSLRDPRRGPGTHGGIATISRDRVWVTTAHPAPRGSVARALRREFRPMPRALHAPLTAGG